MKFKDVVISEASTEAKVAALAVLLDKELLKLGETVFNVQKLQGPKGDQGLQGPKGEQGDRGFDGSPGVDGANGADGRNGEDGKQGVGVQNAHIDFDGALIITLTDGTEINAGDVVPMDVAEKIKVIGSSGGTSQAVFDAVAAIQAIIATYGTMATQNANNVAITGGSINGTTVGATTASTGTFTTLIGGFDVANYGQLTGGATTKAVEFKTLGTDTNVAYAIRSKGTGAIDLAAGSSGVNISNGGTVTAITQTNAGGSYTSLPSVSITAPTTAGGVQAVLQPVMAAAGVPTITSGGTGYSVNDAINVVGGTGGAAQYKVLAVSGGVITSISSNYDGAYTVLPTSPASVTGGTGSGATLTFGTFYCRTPNITNAGSGYVEQPTVTFSGGGGSGAAAYATVGSGTTIRSLGSTGTQSLDFYTPSSTSGGVPALRIRDTTNDSYPMLQGGGGFTAIVAQGNAGASMNIASNGSGLLTLNTNGTSLTRQLAVSHTASAVNYVQVTGGATNNAPSIVAQGSDSFIGFNVQAKSATLGLGTRVGGNPTLQMVDSGASPTNYFRMVGSATNVSPVLSAQGSDTNIDLTLTPKGTGRVKFGTYTANMALTTQGYIEILDSSGTVRKLAVIA